jgi:hypothetical protein
LFALGVPKDAYGAYKEPTVFITWNDSSKDFIDRARAGSGTHSSVKEDYTVMEFDVIGEKRVAESGGGVSDKGGLHIHSLLKKYIEEEKLTPEEAWYCSKCKEHNEAIKKLDLWSTPDVLIVHLKRFLYTPVRIKISEHVDFPITGLDLSPYILGPADADAPPIYDLYGVSEHSGGMSGGHYTAMCKKDASDGTEGDCWYKLNDGFVSLSDSEKVVTDLAYVLFYRRRSGKLKWGGVQPLPEEEQLSDE